jgi:hypothetical protein
MIEQMFGYGSGMGETRADGLVGRWWNGRWGRLARRDIWLRALTTWRVEVRQGDADTGTTKHWDFANEKAAREFVDRLILTGGDGWRDITTTVTRS